MKKKQQLVTVLISYNLMIILKVLAVLISYNCVNKLSISQTVITATLPDVFNALLSKIVKVVFSSINLQRLSLYTVILKGTNKDVAMTQGPDQ